MYIWAQDQLMPLGPGLLWTKTTNGFRKQIMRDQTSLGALQWLTYRQELDGMDSNGKFCQIHHNFHQGEKNVDGYYPDGYMLKDGKHYFYEFNGENIIYAISFISRDQFKSILIVNSRVLLPRMFVFG